MLARLLHRLRADDGQALVSAIVLTGILLLFGLAVLTLTDTQQRSSRREREQESSFQFAEGVLSAQVFKLSTRWPGSSDNPWACPADCPNATTLKAGFDAVDYKGDVTNTWSTLVTDNQGASPTFYDPTTPSTYRWDQNGDGYMWVRASGTVRGHARALVALVKAEDVTLSFPRAVLVAGHYFMSNNGNKDIIDTAGGTGDIIVRCTNTAFPGKNKVNGCADRFDGQGNAQITNDTTRSNPSQPSAITPEALDELRERARSDGNYYDTPARNTCPPLAGDKPGEVVFIEDLGSCTYQGNVVYNTPAKPGILIIARGYIELKGTTEFKGILYHPNLDDKQDDIVRLHGCNKVSGAVVVDGNGGVDAGSCKSNLVYDANVFNNLKTYGTAGIVQNSFRELKPGA